MNACSSNDGSRFLSGVMTTDETGAYEEHLETCPACRRALEDSAGGQDDWRDARELLAFGEARTQANELLDTTGPVDGENENVDPHWLPECTEALVRSILAPSDDPAMVGRVGSYEISGVLGRGAAGIVLKGFDRALNRNVAVKVLDPSLAGVAAARQRFAREARAMAAVTHEHVTPVYEVNEHGGLPFFVMEYVPGGSLERRLRDEGTLDVLSIVRIGLQTAQALAAAHKQGLVHRDIKPGNILVDRGADRVRVADFGLVRVAGDVTCTRSGFVTGTPQYMSPEQVCADACDGQSDLFSLGAVLYALAVGHPPFRADTVYGVMQRIVHDEPRSIREQNPQIPAWLEAFILRLLAKERTARFASADDVATILEAELLYLQNPGPFAPPKREWYKPPRRRRKLTRAQIAALSGGLLAASALAIAATFLPRDITFQQGAPPPTASRGVPAPGAPGPGDIVIAEPRSVAEFMAAPREASDESNFAGVEDDPARRDIAAREPSATVPLWDADGFDESLSKMQSLEWRAAAGNDESSQPDFWTNEATQLRATIDSMLREDELPEALRPTTTTNPPSPDRSQP